VRKEMHTKIGGDCVTLQSRGTLKTCTQTLAVYNTTCTGWHCYLRGTLKTSTETLAIHNTTCTGWHYYPEVH